MQCAWFFVEAFPAHCDCLALANVLAFQLKREDSFDRTGSGNQGNSDCSHSAGGSNSGSGNVESQADKAMHDVAVPRSDSQSNSSSK